MKRLSKQDFKGAKRPEQLVYVPVLNGEVLVVGMSGTQRDEYEASLFKGKGKNRDLNLRNARAKLVVMCAHDPDTRTRMFDDSDVEWLGEAPAAAIVPLSDAAQKLSGISEEEIEEMGKPIGDAASTPTDSPSASSSSASPAN